MKKPLAFAAFANDRETGVRYLRNLSQEARAVRARWSAIDAWDLEVRQNATLGDVLDVFGRDRHRTAIFHFGGHAGSYELLLESTEGAPQRIHGASFADFLGHSRGLQLVFLNACSTRDQALALRQAGVPAVIATDVDVADDVAVTFADEFYRALGGGETLRDSFDIAVAAVRSARGADPRSLYRDIEGIGAVGEDVEWPWDLHCEATAAVWTLGRGADDPLLGLPPLPAGDLPDEPFRHLLPFHAEHAPLFFGRAREIRELYDAVIDGEVPVLLVHGRRGVGKTSLLEAGLVPRLRANHDVRVIRCGDDMGLASGMAAGLACATDPGAILDAWKSAEAEGRPLTWIADQFELALASSGPEGTRGAAAALAAAGEWFADPQMRPAGRLILCFQKEWLAEIEAALRRVAVPRTRHYIDRLDRAGVVDVVTGPTNDARLKARYGLTVDPGLPAMVADDLIEDPRGSVAPILQVLLTRMWKECERDATDRPHFSIDLYMSLRRQGLALDDFIDERLARLAEWNADVVHSGLAIDVLAFHTTPTGYSEQRTEAEIHAAYIPVARRESLRKRLGSAVIVILEPWKARRRRKARRTKRTIVPQLIERLEGLQLLVAADPAESTLSHETRLAHDVLAPLVRRRYETSVAPGQLARRIVESPRMPELPRPNRWLSALPLVLLPVGLPLAIPSLLRAMLPRAMKVRKNEAGEDEVELPERPIHVADLESVDQGSSGTREWTDREEGLIEKARTRRAGRRLFDNVAPFLLMPLIGIVLLLYLGLRADRNRWNSIALADASAEYDAESETGLLLAIEAVRRYPAADALGALLSRLLERGSPVWFIDSATVRAAAPRWFSVGEDTLVAILERDVPASFVEPDRLGRVHEVPRDETSDARIGFVDIVEDDDGAEVLRRVLVFPSGTIIVAAEIWYTPMTPPTLWHDPVVDEILALGDTTGAVQLFDLRSGRTIWGPVHAHDGWVTDLQYSPVEHLLISEGSDGTRMIWDLDPDRLVAAACSTVGQSIIPAEVWAREMPDRDRQPTCRTDRDSTGAATDER